MSVPIIYASLTIELATLEHLVHYFKGFLNSKLPSLLMATMEIPNEEILKIEATLLPKNWKDFPAPNSLQNISN